MATNNTTVASFVVYEHILASEHAHVGLVLVLERLTVKQNPAGIIGRREVVVLVERTANLVVVVAS